jgi:hypothetical protein
MSMSARHMGDARSDSFDWSILDEDVVLAPRRGLAVYLNEAGDVVIREEGGWPNDDTWIIIALADVPAVARRLAHIINEHAEPVSAQTLTVVEPAKPRQVVASASQEAPELPLALMAAQ